MIGREYKILEYNKLNSQLKQSRRTSLVSWKYLLQNLKDIGSHTPSSEF